LYFFKSVLQARGIIIMDRVASSHSERLDIR